jgi:VanZ family protein
MKRLNKNFFLNWLWVFAWMGMIYYFSDQPNLQSSLQPFWDLIFRKIAHVAEYFVLTYLLFRAISFGKKPNSSSLIIAITVAILYAIFDEWHQQSIVGRHGSIIDVLVDSVGVIMFALMHRFKHLLKII